MIAAANRKKATGTLTTPSDHFDPSAYWEARLKDGDLSTVGYQALGLPFNRWLYRLRRRVFLHEVRRLDLDLSGRRVLDIGSGTGFYVAEWLRLQASVTGVDLTETSVNRLSSLLPEGSFIRYDISETPTLPLGSFDAVSAFDVLFHIVDDERYVAAIQNIYSLLRGGGYLLFSENFVHGPTVRAKHQASRSLDEIQAILEEVGLEIVRRRPMFYVMNAPIDSRSSLQRWYWKQLEVVLSRFPSLGGVAGGLLYPLELVLVSTCSEGPSTELMVCRKPLGR